MEKKEQTQQMKENEEIVQENSNEATEKLPKDQAGLPENQTEEQPQINEQQQELVKLQQEIAEQKDKYLRLYSEFENYRRRTSKEKLEMIQSANEQLIKSLLPVADDFERAEKSFNDKNDKDLEGFFLIHSKLKKVLDQYGVKPMDSQAGSEFNADYHEAITEVPAPDESLKGKIVDVVEKGYLLNQKVIRFAKVVVGS